MRGRAKTDAPAGVLPAPAGVLPAPADPDPARIRAAVLAWYAERHRDLPWRRTRDPYRVLVSEVMLQQTQVARVVPRYEAWVARWPTAPDLAAAPLPDVLGAWVGLGYNVRAVRLREACARVTDAGWPRTADGLRALPGVGPYTAAAVASFAFGERVAAVDVNVARVCDRLGVAPGDLLPGDGPAAATWNQAAMELGALVCRSRRPDCDACPARDVCPSAGRVPVATRAGSARPRFQDTDRYVRGRVVRALAHGGALPVDVGPERLERAIAGLRRDGLLAQDGGPPRLAGTAPPTHAAEPAAQATAGRGGAPGRAARSVGEVR